MIGSSTIDSVYTTMNDDPNTTQTPGGPEDDGAPQGEEARQEYDPELMQLPRRRRRRRHPLIAVAVLGLSLFMMWFLREDLLFFFQPRKPVDVGQVAQALEQGKLRHNTYITLHGAPDRKNALILEGRSAGFDSFFRLLQGRDRVFVQRHRELRNTEEEISARHTGRLMRFDSLPYDDALRRYFAANMTVAHDIKLEEVRRGRASGDRATVTDEKGARVTLGPDSLLWINVAFPDEWLVQFRKTAYPKADAAAAKMAEAGLPFARDPERSRLFWRFVARAEPDQVPLLMARFKDRSLHAGVVRRQLSYSARWNQVKVEGQTLEIHAADPTFPTRFAARGEPPRLEPVEEHPVKVPASAVLYITTSSPFQIGDDALVLLTGVKPGDRWYYLALYIVLLGFVIINVVSLVLRLRERRASAQSR